MIYRKTERKRVKKFGNWRKKNESLESKLGDSVDELEQYFRRNCFLLHDVRE